MGSVPEKKASVESGALGKAHQERIPLHLSPQRMGKRKKPEEEREKGLVMQGGRVFKDLSFEWAVAHQYGETWTVIKVQTDSLK